MCRWVNHHFGTNVNDRDLKKVGLENLHQHLYDRAREAIARWDLKPVETFLGDHWNQQSLAAWVMQQYGIPAKEEEFLGMTPEDAATHIRGRIHDFYRRKEIEFPVTVGLTRFMADHGAPGSERYDRDGLVRWAAARFQTRLAIEDVQDLSKRAIGEKLLLCSERFLDHGRVVEELDGRLDAVFGPRAEARNGHRDEPQQANAAALEELLDWANREFQSDLDAEDFLRASREQVQQAVLLAYERFYRPELYQTERSLILDVLDTAWKDHLYYMDHLRAGIGLVGYAQKDPKIEYRREGMKAFDQMWDRIAGQVTGAIFRVETLSPQYVGGLWEVTAASHAAPVDDEPAAYNEPSSNGHGGAARQPGQPDRAVEPIRNFGQKVGRNDPCPCGSGKKYKKCHGAHG
jgi:preprotein translocase subunit SecA